MTGDWTPIERFHHATHWEILRQLLDGALISPGPFRPEDFENPHLAFLDSHGLQCAWFSSQIWTDNRFGPYELIYDTADVAFPQVVELGSHHGARCYFSAPLVLSKWISDVRDLPLVDAEAALRRADKGDRVDLLLPWKVPVARSVEVVQGKTGRGREDDANYARARLFAYLLLTADPRFYTSLTTPFGPAEAVRNLLEQLTGAFSAFAKMAALPALTGSAANDALQPALEHLANHRRREAKEAAAQIGDVSDLAAALAAAANALFGSTVSARDVEVAD